MDSKKMTIHNSITKVVKVEVVTLQNGVENKRTLSGEELADWKKEHGYADTENKTESDTNRETDSNTRESE